MKIRNDAGETVAQGFQSDAETVRWWTENGRPGDYLDETGERLADLAAALDLDGTQPAAPTITTEDRVTLAPGDRAFNYYDHKPGTIGKLDAYPQPDTMRGQSSATPVEEWSNYWFDFEHDDGSRTLLDGSRICSVAYAKRRGWMVTA